MGAREHAAIVDFLRGMDQSVSRRFRINAGTGWVGKRLDAKTPDQRAALVRLVESKRVLALADPRPFHGAPTGWPDLFGWDAVRVTDADVGRVLAVAAGDEVKTGRLKLSDDQRRFGELLVSMGGRFHTQRD